jgi:beta-glucosidase
MRHQLGSRLPEFTPAERALVQHSNDMYGMNHYTADYIRCDQDTPASAEDFSGNLTTSKTNKAGEVIGPESQSPWLRPNPAGFRKLLNWISERYGKPVIYVTENGTSVKGENDLPKEEILEDEFRAEYFRGYVGPDQSMGRDGR